MSPDDVKFLLGLQSAYWEEGNGAQGFNKRYYYDHISIYFGGRDDCVWCDMSGQGCRAFETYSSYGDFNSLFEVIMSDMQDFNITRLDVAYDDHTGVINIKTFDKAAQKQYISTRFRDYGVDKSYTNNGITLYFGSKKSDTLFRCYNKAAERNREDEGHWIRFEMQLRDDRAFQFLSSYFLNNCDIGTTFKGVVNNYMRVLKPNDNDSNKWRWKTAPWWDRFIGDVEKISLYSRKDVDYNFFQLKNYVVNQAGNAIDCMIGLIGVDEFQKAIKERDSNPNPKYKIIEEKYKKFQELEKSNVPIEEILKAVDV